jgi:serine/threonine protein phosphatase PrpC
MMKRVQRSPLKVAARTHPGLVGKQNEDRYAVAFYAGESGRPVLFAVVADGIGGHRAGEVAAELTVNYITEKVAESNGRDPVEILQSAIHTASQVIASRSASEADQEGMGATCACVWLDGNRLYTAHVGDSRIYLVRDEKIQPMTVDHTWVQEAIERGIITVDEAHDHPNVHVLRRHLGMVELPEVDFRLRLSAQESDEEARQNQGTALMPGDILLLCTDGLTDLVWDDEILRLIVTRNSLKSAAEDLVAQANERGGHDNITVVLIGVPKPSAAGPPRKKGLIQNLFGQ